MKRVAGSLAFMVLLAAAAAVWLQSTSGTAWTTADLRGKVTLVNFWATSCATCIAEMPMIAQTHEKYRLTRLRNDCTVAMSYDPPAYVVNFTQTRKLPFAVAIDNTGGVAKAWGDVNVTPTTYLVDKQGVIVKKFVGQPDFPELHKLIERLLAEP